jgi:hypothetical protein
MGLNEKEEITYLSIVNGQIAKKCQESDPKAQPYTKKDGSVIYYRYFGSITGHLTKLLYKEPPALNPEYGAQWVLHLNDCGEKFVLNLSCGSGYGNAFMSILKSINPVMPITIQPSMKLEMYEGKQKTNRSMYIFQNEELLPWYYTNKDPKGRPPVQYVPVPGKPDSISDYDRMLFYKTIAEEYTKTVANIKIIDTPKDDEYSQVGSEEDENDADTNGDTPFLTNKQYSPNS